MPAPPRYSIIIPTLNEAEGLGDLLEYLKRILASRSYEIIIADGGSQDETRTIAARYHFRIIVSSPGRAVQLNAGAKVATGDIFYFLHADSYPPADLGQIFAAFANSNFQSATFRLRFAPETLLLRQSAYFTRFDCNAFRFGDASLLVKRSAFKAIAGYDEDFLLMEDNDIVRRLKKQGAFCIYPAEVRTSSRKYLRYGDWYLQLLYILIYSMQRVGVSQQKLVAFYRVALKGK